ncbi:MAG: tetraprenyl-beta-curcumene synthase family protein [Vulcanimicrobiaceae bacterium]
MQDEISFAVSRVLASGARRRALRKLGVPGITQLLRFLLRIVPQARRALAEIESRAALIPEGSFRKEALASIRSKSYHVAGACFPATFLSQKDARAYIALVSPLESLYDYLDNLCDRHPDVPLEAYPVLHEALHQALDPQAETTDYFRAGLGSGDGGYLQSLVTQTRQSIRAIPGYEALLDNFREAASFYTALQTYKHYTAGARAGALEEWHTANASRFGNLAWWEFAAACGSQFHVYMPILACLQGAPATTLGTYAAYFPAFCALHVLLDDFIDQAEDRAHGELNFVTLYPSAEAMHDRFAALAGEAAQGFRSLDRPQQHVLLLRVLLLFYLTHRKVYEQGLDAQAQAILEAI